MSERQKWEYLVTEVGYDDTTYELLGRCGNEGWELVAIDSPVVGQKIHRVFYFKRPAPKEGE